MSKPLSSWLYRPFYLLLLPIYFVLHGFTYHYPLISSVEAIRLLLLYCGFTLLSTALFFLFFKRWSTAALFTIYLLSFEFYFGVVQSFLKRQVPAAFFSSYGFLCSLFLLLSFVFLLYLKKKSFHLSRLHTYLNVLLFLFVAWDSVALILKQRTVTSPGSAVRSYTGIPCDTCSRPDIYFIIADEYAGAQELNDLFGFDNRPFLQQLTRQSFHVIERTSSNYNYTPFSVASVLEMRYLPNISLQSNDPHNRQKAFTHISNNEVTRFLQQYYTFRNYSPFEFASQPTLMDNEFMLTREKLITSQTFTHRAYRDLGFNLVTRLHWQNAIKRFGYYTTRFNTRMLNETLAETLRPSSSPRFVYTHLFLPHYPYAFDRNGNPYPPETLMEGFQINKNRYLEYLQYANKKLLGLVATIKKNTDGKAIIILMSDHGFRHFTEPVSPAYHFMNLNAIYLPSGNYTGFYDGMSGVNQFRVVFNTQFGQRLPLLPDTTIFLREY